MGNENEYDTDPAPSYETLNASAPLIPVVNSNQQPQYYTMPYIQTQVILVGGCPACRVGVLEDDYTCCGIMCALLFFPLGILCCLATKQRRCSNCGATFG